jgi:hypothetical protein
MKKKLNTLNEQLSRMKKLMKFKIGENSHDILSENFINEQKPVDPKDLENIKPSDSKIIGIGTVPEKKEKPKVKSTQTTKTSSDVFKGTIQDIYVSLGACKGIIKQINNFALELSNPNIDKESFTYKDFALTIKKTKKILDIEIKKGDTKNTPTVQKILDFSKNNLDSDCVKKFQNLLLKYTNSKDKMETPEGKKKYVDGVVGILTLSGFVEIVIEYYRNIFNQHIDVLTKRYFEKELTGEKPESSKGLPKNVKRRADTSGIPQKTPTKQSLKDE